MRFLNDWDGYQANLKMLESRLSKRVYKLMSKPGYFHDAELESMVFHTKLPQRLIEDPTVVELNVIHVNGYTYTLRYSGVVMVNVNFDGRLKTYRDADGKEYPWPVDDRGFDDWDYDELSIVDAKYLSHEILLHSGARIILHFRTLNFKRSVKKCAK